MFIDNVDQQLSLRTWTSSKTFYLDHDAHLFYSYVWIFVLISHYEAWQRVVAWNTFLTAPWFVSRIEQNKTNMLTMVISMFSFNSVSVLATWNAWKHNFAGCSLCVMRLLFSKQCLHIEIRTVLKCWHHYCDEAIPNNNRGSHPGLATTKR